MKTNLAEFLSAFVVEGEEHLRAASANLLAIEAAARTGKANVGALRELFRSIHTLKGLSSMVAVEPIVAITHRMETALRSASQVGGKLSVESIDALVEGLKAVGLRLREVSAGAPVEAPSAALLAQLDRVEGEVPLSTPGVNFGLDPQLWAKLSRLEQQQLEAGLAAGHRVVRIPFIPSRESAASGRDITSVRAALGKLAEIVKVIPVTGPQGLEFRLLMLTVEPDEALAGAAGVPLAAVELLRAARAERSPEFELEGDDVATSTQGWGVVRVDVSRLDTAMDALSALIVTRFHLSAAVARMTEAGVDTRTLQPIIATQRRQQRDLRAQILKLRMVSVSEVLERVPLLFRGLKRETGKQVRLEMDVGNAELDKAVAERLFPAIVHLIRNAVDHAIEAPEARKAAGKPEEGVVRISCTERSNTHLELVVSDDGRGIDAVQIARRAGREIPVTDAGLLELMCTIGLSTRDVATTTSGRGVGMDIVRRVATGLGGELVLRTVPGQSTALTLQVPLTIAVVDAFALECGGERFLVPVSAIEEIVEIEPDKVIQAPDTAKRGRRAATMLDRKGRAIPMMSLEALFTRGEGRLARKALVVRRGEESMAFAVDRMLGQQEVVVRPLEDSLIKVLGVSGSTDLGDGKPTLVLDLLSLATSLLASSAVKPEVTH